MEQKNSQRKCFQNQSRSWHFQPKSKFAAQGSQTRLQLNLSIGQLPAKKIIGPAVLADQVDLLKDLHKNP